MYVPLEAKRCCAFGNWMLIGVSSSNDLLEAKF
jgi:hypothetical protein